MDFSIWFAIVGGLLLATAAVGTLARRFQLTSAVTYLVLGVALGPSGLEMIRPSPATDAVFLERVTEVVVIISLFTAGLKLRVGLGDRDWLLPLRLAVGSMVLTVGLVALVGVWLFSLPVGAAVLLGAILAPTDPVLAGDVGVSDTDDRDPLRFGLTGEAGLNDGTAFPFVLLGLGLMGQHTLGEYWLRWASVDVIWAVAGGLGIGALLGGLTAAGAIRARRQAPTASAGFDDFVSLGLIALTYGVALAAQTYGFLAVFAAGLAMRRTEDLVITEPEDAEAAGYRLLGELHFNRQLERIGEVAVVVILGAMLAGTRLELRALAFVGLLFFAVRPLAAGVALAGSPASPAQRRLIAWFGVRGVGSLYYLMFALTHGLPDTGHGALVTDLVVFSVAMSVAFHGASSQPLLARYHSSGPKAGA